MTGNNENRERKKSALILFIVILNELESNKGTQFDPKIADIMLELLRSGEIKTEE